MVTAGEVAKELRKYAECLEKEPDMEVKQFNIYHFFYNHKDKNDFKDTVRSMPRPLKKEKVGNDIVVKYTSDALRIQAEIPQSATCTLIEPAKAAVYKCDPILSEDEEEELVK